MKSGEIRIDEKTGKIILVGELFEQRMDGVVAPFECCVDTGCSFDLCIPQDLANAVFAQPEEVASVSTGAGATSLEGTYRIINVRFGACIINNIKAFVPNQSISRSLIGITLLQKMNIYLGIDFKPTSTAGSILTNDRKFPFIFGKIIHCVTVHNKQLVTIDPCQYCGQNGDLSDAIK